MHHIACKNIRLMYPVFDRNWNRNRISGTSLDARRQQLVTEWFDLVHLIVN